MDKRAFTSFTDNFLQRAGREYMSMQEIDKLKRQEKLAKENLTYQKKKHKESTELDIAKLIVSARQKKTEAEAPLAGHEKLADVQADRLAKGEPTYITEKRGEFSFGYEGVGDKGGGAKAATESQWLTALRANEDDRRAIVDKLRGSIDMDSKLQVAVDATAEFEKVETYEGLNTAYNNVMAQLETIAKQGEIQLPLVDAAKNDLARYYRLIQDRIWYNTKLGRTPGASTQAQPVTKPAVEKPKPSVITEEVKRQVKDAWFDKSKAIAWKYEKLAEIAENNGITDVQVLIDIVMGK